MKKAKVEIKVEPYPKGGWYVVERVGGKVWWHSSNYQSIELAEVRMEERKELKANTAEWLNNKLARRSKPKTGLATKPTLVKRISKAKMRYLKRFDEYNEMRNQQPESERQTEFQLTEIHRLFWRTRNHNRASDLLSPNQASRQKINQRSLGENI